MASRVYIPSNRPIPHIASVYSIDQEESLGCHGCVSTVARHNQRGVSVLCSFNRDHHTSLNCVDASTSSVYPKSFLFHRYSFYIYVAYLPLMSSQPNSSFQFPSRG